MAGITVGSTKAGRRRFHQLWPLNQFDKHAAVPLRMHEDHPVPAPARPGLLVDEVDPAPLQLRYGGLQIVDLVRNVVQAFSPPREEASDRAIGVCWSDEL
jgi:hypothetical protein